MNRENRIYIQRHGFPLCAYLDKYRTYKLAAKPTVEVGF